MSSTIMQANKNIIQNNINKRNNRFNIIKPSILKKIGNRKLNSFNEGNNTFREKRKNINSNNNIEDKTLSDDKSKTLNFQISNNQTSLIEKTNTTTSYNKCKKIINNSKNKNEFFNLNYLKSDLYFKNPISLNNSNNSFFKTVSKSRSINKDGKSEKYLNTVGNSGKKKKIIDRINKIKDKEKSNIIKIRTTIGKKYIYVKKNQIRNQNNNLSYIALKYNTINSERLDQRFKKIKFNQKIKINTNKIGKKNKSKEIKNNNITYTKKFTFNDLRTHNELLKNSKKKEKKTKNVIQDNISVSIKNKNNNKSSDIRNILDYNHKYSKINVDKINKTQDNIKNNQLEYPQQFILNRKNKSAKKGNIIKENNIIKKILINQFNDDKSIDTIFQKTTTNFLYSKIESLHLNKSNKKLNRYCNLLLLDKKDKKELYTQTKNHNSFSDRSKLIDYINFKVTNNNKEKKINNSNNISSINKSKKKENKSRNNNNKYNYTNSNSITIENNNTNYILLIKKIILIIKQN